MSSDELEGERLRAEAYKAVATQACQELEDVQNRLQAGIRECHRQLAENTFQDDDDVTDVLAVLDPGMPIPPRPGI